ncbi:hypothetical protein ACFX10_028411 [Malus domestica]
MVRHYEGIGYFGRSFTCELYRTFLLKHVREACHVTMRPPYICNNGSYIYFPDTLLGNSDSRNRPNELKLQISYNCYKSDIVAVATAGGGDDEDNFE